VIERPPVMQFSQSMPNNGPAVTVTDEVIRLAGMLVLEDFLRKPVTGSSALSLAVQPGPGEQLRSRLALCERKSAA
jgi:hypothetical protein